MNENILTWNFVNWVTIVLMAAVGFLILAATAQGFHAIRGTGNGAAGSGDPTAVGAIGG